MPASLHELEPVEEVDMGDTKPWTAESLNQVAQWPLVSSGWSRLWDVYASTKEYNQMTQLALGSVEKSLSSVANRATPYMDTLAPHLSRADHFVCGKLENIEERIPMVKRDPKEVVAEVGAEISAQKQRLVDGVEAGREAITQRVNRNKQLLVDNRDRVNHMVMGYLDGAISKAESVLDYWLPEPEEDGVDAGRVKEIVGIVEEVDPVAIRVRRLGSSARSRAYKHTQRRLYAMRNRAKHAVDKLQYVVVAVDYYKGEAQGLQQSMSDRAHGLQQSMCDHAQGLQQSMCDRLGAPIDPTGLQLARNMARQLRDSATALLEYAPPGLRSGLELSRDYAEGLYAALPGSGLLSAQQLLDIRRGIPAVRSAVYQLSDALLNSWLVQRVLPQVEVDRLDPELARMSSSEEETSDNEVLRCANPGTHNELIVSFGSNDVVSSFSSTMDDEH